MKRLFRLLCTLSGLFAAVVLILLLSSGRAPTKADGYSIYHVAPGGNCGGALPCYASVQAAVDAADNPSDVIRVAAGTYTGVHVRPRADVTTTGVVTQMVYLSKTVSIQGGYITTDWDTAHPITQPTTLDAQKQGRVFYITGDITATIKGLHITGGDANEMGGRFPTPDFYAAGGGVYVITATAILKSNHVFKNTALYGGSGVFLMNSGSTIIDNAIYSNTAYSYGSGLCILFSSVTITKNNIYANHSETSGGGLYLWQSDVTLSDSAIYSNTARWGAGLDVYGSTITLNNNAITSNANYTFYDFGDSKGGGMYLAATNGELTNNVISFNTSNYGGGVYLSWSDDITLTNTVIANNNANVGGGGLHISECSPRLVHTTITRNSSGTGIGLYVDAHYNPHHVVMTNTIIVGHAVGITVTAGNTATLNNTLWYNNGSDWDGEGMVNHYNDYAGNPAFASDGYHLTVGSAAINKGVDAGVTTDVDGEPRPYGTSYDLGADEIQVEPKKVYLPLVLRQYP